MKYSHRSNITFFSWYVHAMRREENYIVKRVSGIAIARRRRRPRTKWKGPCRMVLEITGLNVDGPHGEGKLQIITMIPDKKTRKSHLHKILIMCPPSRIGNA